MAGRGRGSVLDLMKKKKEEEERKKREEEERLANEAAEKALEEERLAKTLAEKLAEESRAEKKFEAPVSVGRGSILAKLRRGSESQKSSTSPVASTTASVTSTNTTSTSSGLGRAAVISALNRRYLSTFIFKVSYEICIMKT